MVCHRQWCDRSPIRAEIVPDTFLYYIWMPSFSCRSQSVHSSHLFPPVPWTSCPISIHRWWSSGSPTRSNRSWTPSSPSVDRIFFSNISPKFIRFLCLRLASRPISALTSPANIWANTSKSNSWAIRIIRFWTTCDRTYYLPPPALWFGLEGCSWCDWDWGSVIQAARICGWTGKCHLAPTLRRFSSQEIPK